jgi:hypothetical protein
MIKPVCSKWLFILATWIPVKMMSSKISTRVTIKGIMWSLYLFKNDMPAIWFNLL